jgi:hypothetical protein
MRHVFILLIYFGVGVVGGIATNFAWATTRHDPYSFACNSAHYMLGDFAKQPSVPSPDGKKAVRLTKEYKFRVVANDAVLGSLSFPEISSNIEIGWSPDSSQFFISYSDGGEVGRYYVHLYRILGDKLAESQIPRAVAARFKAKHWCETRGTNLFFLDWAPDSKVGFLWQKSIRTATAATRWEGSEVMRLTFRTERFCASSPKKNLP